MKTRIQSSKLGSLVFDEEEMPDFPRYTGKVPFGRHGVVEVNLTCLEGKEGDWQQLLSRAELVYPKLVEVERALLQQSQARILALHRSYFGHIWTGTEEALVKTLTLHHWNIFDEGGIELWYEGGSEFNCLDVNLNLDSGMRVAEVRFDG
ncbi:hypothetical protein DB345_20860 [Spartobacteria bacterium LR76]|nr:hypothetical protein DB345_20860 [Spartobacteria bacterium LR76]